MKKKLLLLGLILSQTLLVAQEEDAWVFFTDKENVTEALANPITIYFQI